MLFAALVLSILSIALSTSLLQSQKRSSFIKWSKNYYHATFSSDNSAAKKKQTFPLFDLPPEIRLQIYRYALPQRQTIILTRPSAPQCPFPPSSPLPAFVPAILLRLHTNCPCQTRLTPPFLPLLQTSRMIRREAQDLFYANNAFVLNIDMPKTLLRMPELFALFENGMADGGEILGVVRDFRIRVGGNVMVDACGPGTRWRKYGGRVLVATTPSDEITGMLRSEENIAKCVGKVLDDVEEGGRVNVSIVKRILDEIFWNWEEKV
ncbi:hypothetical protein AUEXF2481DRAFT_220936 [Aureobasidium subglaciale EXF-2481]|uniref:DUF7730 domain-containing protein n=1 Tax=Aureobasidium subglaciale (strain EXF-2481) TaxID=1043005 RepID=A0A074YCI6_AURSE|nr:uncharacterized protein AUEXF2481DRAFT_220936 [Aureobasidium subglaciale EXF-2481]KEQ95503.1 hypothetical protein AUEXF2481DRAFT_220936 [Aureobasidium subglaciale EXF-2481]